LETLLPPWTVSNVSVHSTSSAFQAQAQHSAQNSEQLQAQEEAKWNAPKATCLLNCLQKKIVNLEGTKNECDI